MLKPRWAVSLVVLAISGLQAWDSHALQAEGFVLAMIAAGVLLPAIAVLTTFDTRLRAAAVVAAGILFIVARMISSVRLPELALAAFFPGWIVLVDHLRSLRPGAVGQPRT